MNVRGAGFRCLLNQLIHQLDHGGFTGEFLELLDVIQELDGIDVARCVVLEFVTLRNGLINFRGNTDAGDDPLAGIQRQCFQYIAVLGVGHGHGQVAILLFEDQYPIFPQKLVRDLLING